VADGAPLFEVDDSGPGIATEERRSILLRFQRGTATRDLPGHGLGLAIVAAIVHLHGFAVAIGDGDFGGAKMTLGCRRATKAAVESA
jgi:signal transduction histidine kinase